MVVAVEIYQPIDGVNDSKLLSASCRKLLADQIRQHALQIAFGSASNNEIDQLGLAVAQKLAYERCLADIRFDLLLTDHLHLPGGGGFISAVRGDSLFYPVAAASIVAKVCRDQLMRIYHQFHPRYCWYKNVGYGTPAHQKTLDAIGPSPVHRLSFLDQKRARVLKGEQNTPALGSGLLFDGRKP